MHASTSKPNLSGAVYPPVRAMQADYGVGRRVYKHSGSGRTGGLDGLHDFMRVKNIRIGMG